MADTAMSDREDFDGEDVMGLPLDDCFDSDSWLPQLDYQILGPSWIARRQEANITIGNLPPPLPPSHPLVATVYCSACQLTWLRGFNCDTHAHPLHNAVTKAAIGPGRALRSILVSLGASSAPNRAAYSVYFGPNSQYNAVAPAAASGHGGVDILVQGGVAALELILRDVVPGVVARVREAEAAAGEGGGEDEDAVHFRVLLATDSEFLVGNICDSFQDTTQLSLEVVELFDDLYSKLEEAGIGLQWYLVPVEENEAANALARGA